MADTDELVTYHGGAQPGDDCFANVVAVDEGIYQVLARRERRRKMRKADADAPRAD